MARELLSESRIPTGVSPDTAYGAAANKALGHITERWNQGYGPPGDATHVRNVHVHDGEGNLVGFRLYLVWNETQRYGKAEIETLQEP